MATNDVAFHLSERLPTTTLALMSINLFMYTESDIGLEKLLISKQSLKLKLHIDPRIFDEVKNINTC